MFDKTTSLGGSTSRDNSYHGDMMSKKCDVAPFANLSVKAQFPNSKNLKSALLQRITLHLNCLHEYSRNSNVARTAWYNVHENILLSFLIVWSVCYTVRLQVNCFHRDLFEFRPHRTSVYVSTSINMNFYTTDSAKEDR